MKKILVTTDFSEHSKAGVHFALQLAAQTGASLIFCHVMEIMKPTRWSAKTYARFLEAKKADSEKRTEKFIDKVIDGGRWPADYRFLSVVGNKVYAAIIEAALSARADVICISSRGAGRVKRLLGTNASALILRSPLPLAVIPYDYSRKKIRRLFYATDLASLSSEVRIVKDLSLQLGATVSAYHYDYLLQVNDDRSELQKQVAKYQSTAFTFTFKGQEIELSLAEHLSRDIKKAKADLVIIFTKQNRNWFERLIERSQTANLAFHGRLPMLVFRKAARGAK